MEEEIEIVELFINNKTRTEATYRLAEYIVKKYEIITVGEKEREMFIYKDGMYYPGAENLVIFPEIQRILAYHVNKNAKMETYHKIADMTSKSRSIFQETLPRYIPLKNGVYDIEMKELLPHSPKYKFTYQFPIVYDFQANAVKTQAFFDQVLTPEQRTIVEEWMGYYFYRNYMFKKAIIFVGEGDTGKTTLLEVIAHLIGADNISSVSLHKMSSDKFSAAHLHQKHANIVDELSANDVSDTGAFKMATGDGSITGEHKFGNQFVFHNFSKFTFACNKIPDVKDTDDSAYFARWMVVRFENIIEKKIPNFVKTLQTDEERAGLFNMAIDGLARILKNGHFSYKKSWADTKLEMMRSGSSIAMFASDMLSKEADSEVTKEEMYEAYAKYCDDNDLSKQTKDMLGKKLNGYVPYISDGVLQLKDEKGKRMRGWRNVKIRGKEVTKKEIVADEVEWGDFKEVKQDE